MAERERQTMSLSRQSILAVTGVGVGLLTLVYVLGVQVGKRSAALRRPATQDAGENLDRMPIPLKDQLKALEQGHPAPEPAKAAPPADGQPPEGTPADPKGDPKADPKGGAPEESRSPGKAEEPAGERWTLQLISTPDGDEARRVAAKAKMMGLECVVLKEKGLHKVRLAKPAPRAALNKTYNRLKGAGYKPFPMKVD